MSHYFNSSTWNSRLAKCSVIASVPAMKVGTAAFQQTIFIYYPTVVVYKLS